MLPNKEAYRLKKIIYEPKKLILCGIQEKLLIFLIINSALPVALTKLLPLAAILCA